ncbi:MlaA family lipoprotein [Candidatus Fokinia crypta]|uniref:MlaA family lipoprotein n=1 Tax=Candidatus Fokinia crypta TaxID=1920990 RepID=A0ABZ0UT19_9RICK|nr:MlaA family lipoprotein [Candidatus Fokinia cryptica]WPX98174.1 Putative MlaA family lipoprotein [Candidatus Fokinia cryptica]
MLGKIVVAFTFLCGCFSTLHRAVAVEDSCCKMNDMCENSHRSVMTFNTIVSDKMLFPVAKAVRGSNKEYHRGCIHNFFYNLREPLYALNGLLQGDLRSASQSMCRFMFNTTVGLLGTIDVASKIGIPEIRNGFAVTFTKWGIRAGNYNVIPLFGPSCSRDTFALAMDFILDPLNLVLPIGALIAVSAGETIVAVDENLDIIHDINDISLDQYAALKAAYVVKYGLQADKVNG